MALFLFRPHIENDKGEVTTPDVVVDRVYLDNGWKPVGLLSSELCHQAGSGQEARSAYAVTALGGGAIISPMVVLETGVMAAGRLAWRLSSLAAGTGGSLTLNGASVDSLASPANLIESAGGADGVLPRGVMAVCTGPQGETAELQFNDADGRVHSISCAAELELPGVDRWGGSAPPPRYSVGPTQRDVPHFV